MFQRSGLRFANFVGVPRCKQPVPMPQPPILIDLALPGGGSHGAFTWRLHLAGARTALEKFLAPRLRGGANRPASGDCSYADNNLQADSGGGQ
jgi:hypothetical protein